MCDECASELSPLTLTEVHHTVRQTNLFEQLHKLRSNRWSIHGWLQDDSIATDDRSSRHSYHDGEGEVPRRNHSPYTQRNVAQLVALAGELDRRLRLIQPERLTCVELEEVDGLAYIGVGL